MNFDITSSRVCTCVYLTIINIFGYSNTCTKEIMKVMECLFVCVCEFPAVGVSLSIKQYINTGK